PFLSPTPLETTKDDRGARAAAIARRARMVCVIAIAKARSSVSTPFEALTSEGESMMYLGAKRTAFLSMVVASVGGGCGGSGTSSTFVPPGMGTAGTPTG